MKYDIEFLINLYRTMVSIRCCEERLVEPIMKEEIRTPCHLYSGQEGIAAGICAALEPGDYVFGNHRSHGHFIAKGGSMREMVAEIYCRETGCSRGRGGSMHLIDPGTGMFGSAPIVAGTISLAVGAALASSIRGDNRISVSFFGDGAANEGGLFESLNFASLWRLPIIFVCENNLYATHMPIKDCRLDQDIYKVAQPFDITARKLDGNDVMAVYEAAHVAVEKCRGGDGPLFLECLTYRLRGHVGPDDNIQGFHTDIRPQEEVEAWRKKDPILRFEKYLLKYRVIGELEIQEVRQEVEREVEEAIAFAIESPWPDEKNLGKYVFKERGR